MDLEYSGEHSITFYDVSNDKGISTVKKNTWTDFCLIPVERPFVNYSSPNISIVSIPGTNKRFDVTDYHAGGLTFGPRTGVWEFYIDHSRYNNWKTAYDIVFEFIHGKELYVSLSDEPSIFYKGFLSVDNYVPGSNYSKIFIRYDLNHDIMIGLLNSCPIKFIGENSSPYANDYGFSKGSEYVVKLSNNKKGIFLYDLIVIQNGGG